MQVLNRDGIDLNTLSRRQVRSFFCNPRTRTVRKHHVDAVYSSRTPQVREMLGGMDVDVEKEKELVRGQFLPWVKGNIGPVPGQHSHQRGSNKNGNMTQPARQRAFDVQSLYNEYPLQIEFVLHLSQVDMTRPFVH